MSLVLHPFDESESPPPECAPTLARFQQALDGEPVDLTSDDHAAACPVCRERLRALSVLLGALAEPHDAEPVPAGFADRVLASLQNERPAERRSLVRYTAWAALAAALLVGVYFALATNRPPDGPQPPKPNDLVKAEPETAPAPRERSVRIGDAVAQAGQSLREAPKPLADSVAVAPKLFDALAGPIAWPAAQPMGADVLEPARQAVLELPTAAREALEPVTDTATKAYARFLRDLGAVKPNS
jgi:predicted anti-sigma-YlaC factor YlaD